MGLGQLDLEVPEFVELKQDEDNRMALLSVQDSDVKVQKEMWGEYSLSLLSISLNMSLY